MALGKQSLCNASDLARCLSVSSLRSEQQAGVNGGHQWTALSQQALEGFRE